MATTSDTDPILASWKISQLLQHHPQLLDVLIDLSPAFAKLRNPAMRKVQSRLVTVAQAAGIAGLEPAELTRRLNQAAGITSAPATAAVVSPARHDAPKAPLWAGTAPVAAELDVRPLMARGEEPFQAIMTAARGIPPGAILRLTVGFEPLPLYDALAKQGFAYSATERGDAWEVQFYRQSGQQNPTPAPETITAESPALDWDAPASAEVSIDVSELVPPEPMIKILQALKTLPPDGRLLVHHVRRPIHLYERLNQMNYAHATRERVPGQVEVMIQKRAATTNQS